MSEPVINEESERILGRDAQRNNILAARVIAETVKTTLGPRGMDKMLVDRTGNVLVTNDGVTILEEMEIEHPAAKMVVEIAKTQEKEVGDGTTTAVMLAGKLLENAERLLEQKIHASVISRGYRWAAEKSVSILKELSIEISTEEELAHIAQTAMTGKGVEFLKEKFGALLVDAVKTVAEGNTVSPQDIVIEKQKGGSLEQSELIKGIVLLEKRTSNEMPRTVTDAKIAVIEEPLEVKSLNSDSRISVSSPEQLQSFFSQEENQLREKVEQIRLSGAKAVFVRQGIDSVVSYYLAKEGIFAVSRIPRETLTRIAKATGATIVSQVQDLSKESLGYAGLIEEKQKNDESTIFVTQCENPKTLTILLRGGSQHVMEEAQRAINDALGDVAVTLTDSQIVAGGGSVEIELSRRLYEFAKTLTGRERLAVEAFAQSLEFIPSTLAENAGLDPIDILTELRASHDAGNKHAGLNLLNEKIENTLTQGVIEPLRIKTQAITSASEVAMTILRIDDVIAAKKFSQKKGIDTLRDYE